MIFESIEKHRRWQLYSSAKVLDCTYDFWVSSDRKTDCVDDFLGGSDVVFVNNFQTKCTDDFMCQP
jgi:hypothetical protein